MKKLAFALVFSCGCAAGAPQTAQWDSSAAQDVRAVWDRTMQLMGSLDLQGTVDLIADDGFIGAYDLDMQDKPVTLSTKAEASKFMEGMMAELKKGGGTMTFKTRSFECRATSTFAVCRADMELAVTIGGQT